MVKSSFFPTQFYVFIGCCCFWLFSVAISMTAIVSNPLPSSPSQNDAITSPISSSSSLLSSSVSPSSNFSIIPSNWVSLTTMAMQDPYHCWFSFDNFSISFTHSCLIQIPIEMNRLYQSIPPYYHAKSQSRRPASSSSSLSVATDLLYFNLSMRFQRVDPQIHRKLTIFLKIQLENAFFENILLNEQQLDYLFQFTFPIVFLSHYQEDGVTPSLDQEEFFRFHPQRKLIIEYSFLFDEITIPLQNYHIEDTILFKISNLTIDYLPPIPKFPLRIRSSKEIIASLFNQTTAIPLVYQEGIDIEQLQRKLEEACDLLGTPHANILNSIGLNELHDILSLPSISLQSSFSSSSFNESQRIKEEEIHDEPIISLPKLFCGIYTTDKQRYHNVQAIIDTWGRKCASFLAFSTIDDPLIPSINLPHLGSEKYGHMWQKSRSIWQYIHTHYLMDYDWFLLGGDDMFYIMENLYLYLLSKEIQEEAQKGKGVYIGRPFFNYQFGEFWYNTGGPGYILDRIAVQKLMTMMDNPACHPTELTSIEDIFLASCLRLMDPAIFPVDTRDPFGRHRFHYFSPGYLFDPGFHQPQPQKQHPSDVNSTSSSFSFSPSLSPFSFSSSSSLNELLPSEEFRHIAQSDVLGVYGRDCCSSQSISFHYCNHDLMRRLNDYLYLCPWVIKEQYYQILQNGNWSYYEADFQQVMSIDLKKYQLYRT